ncbi:hypothetical protein JYU34_016680 [Plutella xylostella]|uniref:MADF domain-containing protein n=1 Tax=Plutella xylostella TaxID=51655 RepID=A0ABQ7Q380_PLUXY|nr:hypothetical protein JYU34_016680 [Plutella xylostella]
MPRSEQLLDDPMSDYPTGMVQDLIDMYYEREFLWQERSRHYKDKALTEQAYEEMANFLRKSGFPDATANSLQKQFQIMRQAVITEKKKIDKSQGRYIPDVWYYDLMTFLTDQHEKPRLSSHPRPSKSLTLRASWFAKKAKGEKSVAAPAMRKKVSSQAVKHDETPADVDEFEAIGINYASKLKRMNSKQQIIAELLIQKVIAKGLMGELSTATELVQVHRDKDRISSKVRLSSPINSNNRPRTQHCNNHNRNHE